MKKFRLVLFSIWLTATGLFVFYIMYTNAGDAQENVNRRIEIAEKMSNEQKFKDCHSHAEEWLAHQSDYVIGQINELDSIAFEKFVEMMLTELELRAELERMVNSLDNPNVQMSYK